MHWPEALLSFFAVQESWTAVADPFVRDHINVVTYEDRQTENQIPYQYATFVENALRAPNTITASPVPARASDLSAIYDQWLEQAQNHLLGTP